MTIHYIEVLRDGGNGFWEVDTEAKKALFRESTHTIPDGHMIHDWTEVYKTITDYLQAEMQSPLHIKEIIADRKYIFNSDPICAFSQEGLVSGNPSQKVHCTQTATVIKAGQPLCSTHANVNF